MKFIKLRILILIVLLSFSSCFFSRYLRIEDRELTRHRIHYLLSHRLLRKMIVVLNVMDRRSMSIQMKLSGDR